MRYSFVSATPGYEGKFEIRFSNGVDNKIVTAVTVDKDTWCLTNDYPEPENVYPSIGDLIINFMKYQFKIQVICHARTTNFML